MTTQTWNERRIMLDAHNRYVVEVDAVAEVARLNRELAKAQEDAKVAFALAEQAQKDLDATKVAMETLRALASVSLNKDAPADDRHGLAKERAEAEARAWVRKYQELEGRLDATQADSELLKFMLGSFSSANNGWHWLHVTAQGDTPRAALESLKDKQPAPTATGILIDKQE